MARLDCYDFPRHFRAVIDNERRKTYAGGVVAHDYRATLAHFNNKKKKNMEKLELRACAHAEPITVYLQPTEMGPFFVAHTRSGLYPLRH